VVAQLHSNPFLNSISCILLASGAGKSTFLNLMSGKVDRTDGTLKINGEGKLLPK
jgi:ABC-type multidrug transport system ATPase subunit